MRELMPQDLKLEMERLSREEAVAAAEYLAGVVGKAHARQMDATTRKGWRAELERNHSKSLEGAGLAVALGGGAGGEPRGGVPGALPPVRDGLAPLLGKGV